MNYALLTGASKGIGRAIAFELAKKKINVLLVARSSTPLKETAEEIKRLYGVEADYFVADLSVHNAAQDVYNWCRSNNYHINILVNNAGYGLSGDFDSYSVEENTNMMQLNMITLVQMCNIFLPELKEQPKSYILNIASSAAYQSVPFLSLYSASKSFVLVFSRGLAYELKDSHVSVTCICPGPTDTDFPKRAQVGKKALKAAAKFNLMPQVVAEISVKAMFNKKREVITGFANKLGAFFVWLLPKSIIESTSASLYK